MIKKFAAALGLLTIMASAVVPSLASQNSKNTWRNIGIGSAAVGVLGALNHNSTATILGAAGAAYSANRYEQDRHHQSQARDRRRREAARLHWLHEEHERSLAHR